MCPRLPYRGLDSTKHLFLNVEKLLRAMIKKWSPESKNRATSLLRRMNNLTEQ
jgi:hypothetical protein